MDFDKIFENVKKAIDSACDEMKKKGKMKYKEKINKGKTTKTWTYEESEK